MTYESKECLKGFIIPIFLGDTKESRILSKNIFKKLGIVSMICDTQQTFASKMLLCVKFYRLFKTDNLEIFKEQLLDIARKYSDFILIIVPFSDEFSLPFTQFKDELENHFIVTSPSAFFNCAPISNILS